jgi:hypothetical protein
MPENASFWSRIWSRVWAFISLITNAFAAITQEAVEPGSLASVLRSGPMANDRGRLGDGPHGGDAHKR